MCVARRERRSPKRAYVRIYIDFLLPGVRVALEEQISGDKHGSCLLRGPPPPDVKVTLFQCVVYMLILTEVVTVSPISGLSHNNAAFKQENSRFFVFVCTNIQWEVSSTARQYFDRTFLHCIVHHLNYASTFLIDNYN